MTLLTIAQDAAVDTATSPWVLGTLGVIAVLAAIAKAAGPVSESLEAITERRRENRQRAEDARITDLDHQVQHLKGSVHELQLHQARQDAALIAHADWDRQVLIAATEAGATDIPPPPPLWPIDPASLRGPFDA